LGGRLPSASLRGRNNSVKPIDFRGGEFRFVTSSVDLLRDLGQPWLVMSVANGVEGFGVLVTSGADGAITRTADVERQEN